MRILVRAAFAGLVPLLLVYAVAASTSFGQKLGSYAGVDVFSNGDNPFYDDGPRSGYGIEWQCVELVQRYWAKNGWGPNVWGGNAYQMFDKEIPDTRKYTNGSSTAPVAGDILVFSVTKSWPYGHVALVTGVSGGQVTFVQQNVGAKWQDKLPIDGSNRIDSQKGYPPLTGWIHSEKNPKGKTPSVQPSEVKAPQPPTATPAPVQPKYTMEAWLQGSGPFNAGGRVVVCNSTSPTIWDAQQVKFYIVITYSVNEGAYLPLWEGESNGIRCRAFPIHERARSGSWKLVVEGFVDNEFVDRVFLDAEIIGVQEPEPQVQAPPPPAPPRPQAPPPPTATPRPAPIAPPVQSQPAQQQPPPAPPVQAPPVQANARIRTDKSSYKIGDTIQYWFWVSQAGQVRVTDIQQGNSHVVVSIFAEAGKEYPYYATITPPAGSETFRIDLYSGNRVVATAQTTFQVVSQPAPPVQSQPAEVAPRVLTSCKLPFKVGVSISCGVGVRDSSSPPITSVSWSSPGANPSSGTGQAFQLTYSTAGQRAINVRACNGTVCTTDTLTINVTN